ncbi:hypothetical protein RHGRI_033425 [Rhododendron griersonianum]|uniref:Uncharacterized protein n=1 Tax=Rhododendron griersonianum TaxID=479676 RepID=A0AAV6HWN2_9ERIC|nr:hypothetical protein RHGRI_033425 [Rhododendron griersonianum]
MAKRFRLSKSFFAGPSRGSRRLSKAAKGKGIAGSLDMVTEQDLVLDDLRLEDFGSDWVLPFHLAKDKATAAAKFREVFDPAYEPWEEVYGNWDHSDSEDMDSEDREFPNQSCGGSATCANFHIGESSRSNVTMEACEVDGIGCLGVVSNDLSMVSSGCAATESKVDCRCPAGGSGSFDRFGGPEGPYRNLMSNGGLKFRHRQKKVIMGREFILVSRHCLRGEDKRFRFFHMPSLSAVEVKVQEPSLTVSHPRSPNGLRAQEVCVDVRESDKTVVGVPDLFSPSRMDVVDEFPSLPTSCVTASQVPDHQQLNIEGSSSNKVGDGFHDSTAGFEGDLQDDATGPRNLRTKRIMASW